MKTGGEHAGRNLRAWSIVVAVLLAAFVGVLASPSARAANPKALILGDSVSPNTATDGSSMSLEEQQAQAAGFDTTVVTGAQWDAMSASDFAGYQVVIIGDPTCVSDPSYYAAAETNKTTWEPVVMGSGGNKVLIGTDPTYHNTGPTGPERGDLLEKNGIAYAGAVAGATGAYIDLSCAYTFGASNTPVPILDGLSTKGAGQFTVDSAPCEGAISIVAQSGPTSGLKDADLANWGCSVHESFSKWPSDYTPLALATDAPQKLYCANDVETGAQACGEPYIMLSGGGVTITSEISLSPADATNPVGTNHTVTATIKDSTGSPISGKTVSFSVDSGPNVGVEGTAVTDSNGQASFTYTGKGGPGTDLISASFVNDLGATEKATATKTWTGEVSSGADLSIAKTGPHAFNLGWHATWTITVTNNGPGTADEVTVTDTMPDTLAPSSIGGSSSAGSCTVSGSTITCGLGSLTSGATETVSVWGRTQHPGTITNTASVASSTSDPDTSNNTASASATVG